MKKLDNLLNIVDGEILMDMVYGVNSWDYSLYYLYYIDLDEFDNYLEGYTPSEISNMIYYGDFNPNAAYFQIDRCGNIVSYNTYEVLENLENHKEEIVKRFIELYEDGHVDSYYQEVLDILDNKEDIEE